MYLNSSIKHFENTSLEILKSHSGKSTLQLLPTEQTDDHNSWSAFIFVAGTKFRCMFITKFSTITLLSLASERFTDVNEADYIKNVKDFMREYCNLFAGKLKACFETDTQAYLSLPIIARDYHLANIFGVEESLIEQAEWSIGEDNTKIDIKLCYYEKEKFEHYNFIAEHLNGTKEIDDIDFF